MYPGWRQFAPTWKTLEGKFKSIESGKVNIDSKEGLAVAQQLGVLDEGLPNIRSVSQSVTQSLNHSVCEIQWQWQQ
jgi:hypothetical protein